MRDDDEAEDAARWEDEKDRRAEAEAAESAQAEAEAEAEAEYRRQLRDWRNDSGV